MGLFDFFSRKDPTHDWPVRGTVPLRLDLARRELNGITFDASFDALRVLGKPSNPKPVRARVFVYAPLGLTVPLGAQSRVLIFTCVFQAGVEGEADEFPGFAPCRIALQNERGMLLEVTSTTSVSEVEDALGPLAREDMTGDVFSTTIGSVWLCFTFDHAGLLALLDIERGGDGVD